MLNLLLRWVIYALAIVFVSWVVPGIEVESFLSALLVCVILALINTFIKPLIQIITLPVNVLTLGLFSFVINALLLMLAGAVAAGFVVEGFVRALKGSILLYIIYFMSARVKERFCNRSFI